jgi:hypothetical protein
VLRRAYEAFNQRDLEAARALMDPDVEWPNVLQATTLHGRDAVRAYWLDQLETIDPRVEPEAFERLVKTWSALWSIRWCAIVAALCSQTSALPTAMSSAAIVSPGWSSTSPSMPHGALQGCTTASGDLAR